jgi:hypothetical protein
MRHGKTFGGKLRFEGGAIGLSGAAAEILNEEGIHSDQLSAVSFGLNLIG